MKKGFMEEVSFEPLNWVFTDKQRFTTFQTGWREHRCPHGCAGMSPWAR